MPAGLGGQCAACYWQALLEKRRQMCCAALSSKTMRLHFEAYAKWLASEVGERKAAVTINRFLPFFLGIERKWGVIPSYEALLEQFGAAKLRSALLPVTWLAAAGLVVLDDIAKALDSERRRIAAIMTTFPKGTKASELLTGYHNALLKRVGTAKTTLRSARLALSPAAALLRKAAFMNRMPPDQTALDTYLVKAPGQRAAISGFVRHLCDTNGAKLLLPTSDPLKAIGRRRRKLELEFRALMQENGDGPQALRKWVSVGLAYFHGLNKSAGRTVGEGDVLQLKGGLIVSCLGNDYWLPTPFKDQGFWPIKPIEEEL